MTATLTQFSDAGGVVMSPAVGESLDALDAAAVAEVFAEHGLILFRGFETSRAAFKTFSERLCGDFMTYQGGASVRRPVDGEPTVMTVSEPDHRFAIPLHGEMYYAKRRPGVLWFYCARPADADGETTVADAVALYDRLAPATRAFFEGQPIRYVCTHPAGRWQALFHTDDVEAVRRFCAAEDTTVSVNEADGSIVTNYVTWACADTHHGSRRAFINNILTMTWWEAHGVGNRIVRMADGSAIPEAIVGELRAVEADVTRPVRWRPGDVLMVDNTRFMHGRRAFADAGREIYVRLSNHVGEKG